MTTPVSTILSNVTTLLNDAGMVHWTQAELLAWGSEAERELVKLDPMACAKTVSIALVSGAKQSAPADCVSIIDIPQNLNGDAITPTDRKSLDAFMPNWLTTPTSGTVKHFIPGATPSEFFVYPAQNGTPATIKMTHSYIPPSLSAVGNLNVRDEHQARVENYILFRAFSKDSEPGNAERAMAYAKAFYG